MRTHCQRKRRTAMFSMTLICMGKLKEKFYISAAEEYKKRLGAFCSFQLLELPEYKLPEDPNPTQIAQGLSREAELIRTKIPKGAFSACLRPRGRCSLPRNWRESFPISKKRQIERLLSDRLVVRRGCGAEKAGGRSSLHELHDVSAPPCARDGARAALQSRVHPGGNKIS